MSGTMEVGKKLVEFCRRKDYLGAVDALYAPNIVSVEAKAGPDMPARMEGIKAIRGKSEWWIANHEIHAHDVKGPFPHGDRFIVWMMIDVTSKAGPMAGQRMKFEEAALYTVKDGKIVHEEFFYDMPG